MLWKYALQNGHSFEKSLACGMVNCGEKQKKSISRCFSCGGISKCVLSWETTYSKNSSSCVNSERFNEKGHKNKCCCGWRHFNRKELLWRSLSPPNANCCNINNVGRFFPFLGKRSFGIIWKWIVLLFSYNSLSFRSSPHGHQECAERLSLPLIFNAFPFHHHFPIQRVVSSWCFC